MKMSVAERISQEINGMKEANLRFVEKKKACFVLREKNSQHYH